MNTEKIGEDGILKKAYEKAKEVIKISSRPVGLYASGGKKGYFAVWSRDSMISMIGASLVKDDKFKQGFKEVFKQSIITLSENQSKHGQIPNCVDKWESNKPHVDFKTIDSTLWYILGHYVYKKRYNDSSLFLKYKKNIKNSLNWLACQDSGENGLLVQLPTSDWQDAFPHRYGYTINTHALYYRVLNLIGNSKEAVNLKKMINTNNDDGLWNGNFYNSYRWKNHGKYKEESDWFDSLGNLLAIIFDLADKEQALKILNYISKEKINLPHSLRSIYPPITKKSKYWQDYFQDCLAGEANDYSNGGIWGYIGCFYVLALIKYKKFKEAQEELEKIAKINLDWGFPEWVHPINKTASKKDQFQSWEAGMYILAYESFKKQRVLI